MSSLQETLDKWQSQLRKGALELCILGLISREPTYAFAMIQSLQQDNGFIVTEGALYPLLKRLQKDKQVETFWVESDSGPPRKYYRLTAEGKKILAHMSEEWKRFSNFVSGMIQEDLATQKPSSSKAEVLSKSKISIEPSATSESKGEK